VSTQNLALFGGAPMRSQTYPPYNTIGGEEKRRAMAVLDSGLLSGFVGRGNDQFLGGPAIRELEERFTAMFGCAHAVSMNSATSALHAAVVAAGVGPGDEVIVPPYTMSASATAITLTGATPVFTDIEADMFCLDHELARSAITPRTRAIMTVNLFGMASDLSALRQLADENELVLIEDNAQAPGAKHHNQLAGTVGDIGVFSLNRHKTMQVGEGGVAITDDPILAERMQLVRNHGEAVIPDWGRLEHADIAGCNYRLTELQATIAVPQVDRLDELNRTRIELADALTRRLSGNDFLRPPEIRPNCDHVYYLYPMLYRSEVLGVSRDTFVRALKAEGVHASNYTLPVHLMPLFDRDGRGVAACPVTERIEFEEIVVTNICRPPHTTCEIDEFVDAVEKVAGAAELLVEWEAEQLSAGAV
jgi:perosamine synthetase